MQGKKSRPDNVSTAITLLWITLAIGILRSIMEFSGALEKVAVLGLGSGFVIFIDIFTVIIMIFFILMFVKGKNWARITFLVLYILGTPVAVIGLYLSLSTNFISGVLGLGQVILNIIALVFLFQKPSSDWFKSVKN